MGSVGKIAFVVILAFGVVTGVIAYYLFAKAMPQPGIMNSIYRKELPPVATGKKSANKSVEVIDESKFANKVHIDILKGASTQGNPNFEPDATKISTNALVTWTNDDIVPHTATSGTGPQDPDTGKLFDSDMLNSNQKYSIPASKIGTGEHPYYCKIHPYMTGKITVS